MIFSENGWALLLALARLGFCAYRAATQSIIHDEAFSYLRFISGPWSNLYTTYDANNHVLYTILARFSVAVFGVSELSLRLPSLIAGFFFVLGAAALLRPIRLAWIRWLALLAVSLHPLILDFAVAARGYGLSLTLLVWALVFLEQERDIVAGLLLGLAVSANLTIAFPAIAAILVGAALRRSVGVALRLALPAVAIAGAICYLPLRLATRAHFYVGAATFPESMLSLIAHSVRTNLSTEGLFGPTGGTLWIRAVILPVLVVLIAVAMRRSREAKAWLMVLVLGVSTVGIVAAHWMFGVLYPADRTGLWLILVFLLAWAYAAGQESSRAILAVHGALAVLLVMQFATQLETGYFNIWAFDRDTKRIAQEIQRTTAGKPPGSVTVDVSVAQHPALEYYRQQLPIPALKPVARGEAADLHGHDYYVLTFPDIMKSAEVSRLQVLFRDAPVGVLFAKEP